MNRFGLHGKLKALEGQGEALATILLEAAQLVSTAKGCQLYIISRDREEKDTIWVTEVWDSKEDHDNSLKDEKVRALISKALPILDGQPSGGQEFEVLGGFGLDK